MFRLYLASNVGDIMKVQISPRLNVVKYTQIAPLFFEISLYPDQLETL